jgi:hypothetical protein
MTIQLINNGISQNEVIFSYPRRAALPSSNNSLLLNAEAPSS